MNSWLELHTVLQADRHQCLTSKRIIIESSFHQRSLSIICRLFATIHRSSATCWSHFGLMPPIPAKYTWKLVLSVRWSIGFMCPILVSFFDFSENLQQFLYSRFSPFLPPALSDRDDGVCVVTALNCFMRRRPSSYLRFAAHAFMS